MASISYDGNVINKIITFFQLVYLCFKLILNILGFGLELFLIKTKKRKINQVLTIILLFLIWISSFYTYIRKNTPQIEIFSPPALKQTQNVNLITKQLLLTKDEIKILLTNYTKLEQNNIQNLGLYLNLSQLENIMDNEQVAQKYLEKAKNISP